MDLSAKSDDDMAAEADGADMEGDDGPNLGNAMKPEFRNKNMF